MINSYIEKQCVLKNLFKKKTCMTKYSLKKFIFFKFINIRSFI